MSLLYGSDARFTIVGCCKKDADLVKKNSGKIVEKKREKEMN